MAISWRRVISTLLLQCSSEAELAQIVGCSQSTINRLRTGKVLEPSYSVGSRLLDLVEGEREEDEFTVENDEDDWLS